MAGWEYEIHDPTNPRIAVFGVSTGLNLVLLSIRMFRSTDVGLRKPANCIPLEMYTFNVQSFLIACWYVLSPRLSVVPYAYRLELTMSKGRRTLSFRVPGHTSQNIRPCQKYRQGDCCPITGASNGTPPLGCSSAKRSGLLRHSQRNQYA